MIVFAVRNLAMLVTIAGVFGAARAAAQPQDAQLSLTPKIGLYISPGEIVERVHLSNATTLGLAFEVGWPAQPLGLRATFEFAPGIGDDFFDDARHTVSGYAIDLVIKPGHPLARLQPHLIAGPALRQYNFDARFSRFSNATTVRNVAFHAGTGFRFKVGSVSLLTEVSEYFSRFEPQPDDRRWRGDLFVTAGFRIVLN